MEQTIPTTPNGMAQYVIHKDGNNQEYKVVNFDNPEMVLSKGVKLVRALKKSSRHQPAAVLKVVRDRITGIIYGVPAGVDPYSKVLRFQTIEINDQRQFDLSVPQDRMDWAVISRAPYLKGSPFAKGKPSHYLYDVEEEADKKIKNVSEKTAANEVVKNLSHMQIIDMARNCGGIDTKHNSIVVITGELYDFIDSKELNKGAKKFNEIWSMSNRESLTVFNRCRLVGLVSFDINNGWLWKKSSPIGTSEPMAIEYITKNPSLLMAMDNESKSMDHTFQENATTEEKEKVITAMPLHKRVDNNMLKEQEAIMVRMSEKEKQLDAYLSKFDGIVATDVTAAPEIKNEAELSELKALQDRAKKEHGMKHAYTVKDPDKIKAWIEANPTEAKA